MMTERAFCRKYGVGEGVVLEPESTRRARLKVIAFILAAICSCPLSAVNCFPPVTKGESR